MYKEIYGKWKKKKKKKEECPDLNSNTNPEKIHAQRRSMNRHKKSKTQQLQGHRPLSAHRRLVEVAKNTGVCILYID